MGDEDLTLGEVHRGIQRLEAALETMRAEAKADRHKVAGDFQVLLGKHIALDGRVSTMERDIVVAAKHADLTTKDLERRIETSQTALTKTLADVGTKVDTINATVASISNRALGVSLAVSTIVGVVAWGLMFFAAVRR